MVAHIVHAFIMNSLVSTIGVSSTSSSGLDVSLEPVAVVLHLFIASCSRNTNNGFLGTLTATRWTHDDDCTTHSSNKQQVDLHPSGHQQLKVVVATCSKLCHHYQHQQISRYLQCPCILLPRHEFTPTLINLCDNCTVALLHFPVGSNACWQRYIVRLVPFCPHNNK